jgi:hypothetical protein
MASVSAIEDVSSLPGETVHDQDGRTLGEVKEIYAVGDDDTPMWVTVETSTGVGRTRHVFIPIARLKKEGEEIRTPYSFQHIQESPDVDAGDELSEEDDQTLRTYYAIGLADQEMVSNAQSYASQVPDEKEPAQKVDPDEVEGQVREIEDTAGEREAQERPEAGGEESEESDGEKHSEGEEESPEGKGEDADDHDEDKDESG